MTDQRIPIAFDTETHLFKPGAMAPPIVCVSEASEALGVHLHARPEGLARMAEALELAAAGQVLVVGQNISYDLACALSHDGKDIQEIAAPIWRAYDALGVHCTRVREILLDIARGSRFAVKDGRGYRKTYALDELSQARLGIALDKETWRLNYADLEQVPIELWPEGAREYAMGDAAATIAVWSSQEEQRARDYPEYEFWSVESGRQSAYAFALQLMKCRGIMVDQPRVRELRAKLSADMAGALDDLRAAGLIDPKKGSKKMAAIRALIEASWIGEGEVPKTPKGATQTSAEVIEQCAHPALQKLVDYAHAEKILSTFVDKLEAAGDNPIHADTDVLGGDTGRTSCRNPNLQQQPREPGVRECFRARDGHVLIACDYDNQEVRTFAQVLTVMVGRSRLAERFREDPSYDAHTDFAAQLLHIDYAEALRRKKAKDPELLDWRQRAKAAIFGFPGGMGATKFRLYARGYGLNLSQQEAEDLKARYFGFEPYARDYFGIIANLCDKGGGEATMMQLYSGRIRGRCHFPAAANGQFQGLASDASKSALWEVTKRCYGAPGTEGSALLGCRPVVFVHDEIIVEAPEDYAHEAAVELDRVMCEAMQELTPDVPARASPALMRNWTKKADAAFGDAEHGDEGRYIPWEEHLAREAKRKAA